LVGDAIVRAGVGAVLPLKKSGAAALFRVRRRRRRTLLPSPPSTHNRSSSDVSMYRLHPATTASARPTSSASDANILKSKMRPSHRLPDLTCAYMWMSCQLQECLNQGKALSLLCVCRGWRKHGRGVWHFRRWPGDARINVRRGLDHPLALVQLLAQAFFASWGLRRRRRLLREARNLSQRHRDNEQKAHRGPPLCSQDNAAVMPLFRGAARRTLERFALKEIALSMRNRQKY
jgi:hypothetical protein